MIMTRRLRIPARIAAVLAVVAGSTVAWASPALAATATLDVSGTMIFYTAGAGQMNHLVIERSSIQPDLYLFSEVGGQAIFSSDPACSYGSSGSPSFMQCTAPGLLTLVVDVADLDDAVLNWTDRAAYLYGGDGNDSLWLGGRDGVSGYGNGGNGNDSIMSGPGDDIMDGATGSDTAAYYESADPVQASLVTNSGGRSYDTDAYYSIENLAGGGADDTLYGNDATNLLTGGWRKVLCGQVRGGGCVYLSGNDVLYGGGGNDTLSPGSGDDMVFAGAGNDTVWGDEGNDFLAGEAGDDTLHGGPGTNTLLGGAGYDLCWDGTKFACEN